MAGSWVVIGIIQRLTSKLGEGVEVITPTGC
jgi:hypothetical protein